MRAKNSVHAFLYCKMSVEMLLMGTDLSIRLVCNDNENENNMQLNCLLLSGCEPPRNDMICT